MHHLQLTIFGLLHNHYFLPSSDRQKKLLSYPNKENSTKDSQIQDNVDGFG
ncbi:hypothetical protein LINPERPRIM_LOCUS22291 [Linum perenne]